MIARTPADGLTKAFHPLALPAPQPFERFFPGSGKEDVENFLERALQRHVSDKVDLASLIAPQLTSENMNGRLDWAEQMGKIVAAIRRWNA